MKEFLLKSNLKLLRWKNSFMGRVVKPWKELPGRWWRCLRNSWRWHWVLWAGDRAGISHNLDSVMLEFFSSLTNPVIL